MKIAPITIFLFLLSVSCSNSQIESNTEYKLLGNCEGCEAVFEYADNKLTAVDTLPDFKDSGPRLKITGTIYKQDGKTPAENVILYIYHTNQIGIYPTYGNETGWARRHGNIRGWIKTGKDGQYSFYTLKPGMYPNRSQPAHIHPIVLEPDGKYYWLGSYFFEGDSLLSNDQISPVNPRADSPGVLKLKKENGLWIGKRDFILGKNVPDYGD
jgi:protocatechuate 3,4-dioxygenase, beta subunit